MLLPLFPLAKRIAGDVRTPRSLEVCPASPMAPGEASTWVAIPRPCPPRLLWLEKARRVRDRGRFMSFHLAVHGHRLFLSEGEVPPVVFWGVGSPPLGDRHLTDAREGETPQAGHPLSVATPAAPAAPPLFQHPRGGFGERAARSANPTGPTSTATASRPPTAATTSSNAAGISCSTGPNA